jgi:hypothetical protein
MPLWLISYLALLPALPALAGLVHYRNQPRHIQALVWLFGLSALKEIAGFILDRTLHNSLFLNYPYLIIEVWLVLYFLVKVMQLPVRVLYVVAGTLSIAVVVEFMFNPTGMVYYAHLLEIATVITFIFRLVYLVAKGLAIDKRSFTIAGILLGYFITTLVFFLFLKSSVSRDVLYFVFSINAVLNALFNLPFAYLLWTQSDIRPS